MSRRVQKAAALILGVLLLTKATFAAPLLPSIEPATIERIRAGIVTDPVTGMAAADELRARISAFPSSDQRSVDLATANWLRAAALYRTNRPRDAVAVAVAALKTLGKLGDNTALQGELVLVHGTASAALGNIQAALVDYQRAYRIMQAAPEPRGQAIALQNIGIIYRDAGDFASALRYYAQSAEAYKADPALLLSSYNNRGNALIELGRAREASQAYESALTIARTMKSPLLETRILQNLARSQIDAKDYGASERTLRAAYSLADGPAASWRPALDGVAALLALRRNQLDDADRLIRRSFAAAENVAASMPLRDLHRAAYDIFRARGDEREALAHLEEFKKLDDERRALAASSNAALMSARFDFANQDLKIARLNAGQMERDRAIERAGARLRATVLIGLLAASAAIVTLLAIGFFSIRRSRNQVRDANQTLSATNSKLEKALAAKTEFLATTSHEIRTPLNGILGMTQVILADRALPAPVRDRVALVQGAGETMKALVDDILDVAKMETGEIIIHPAPTQLVRLLDDAARVWTDQASAKNLALEIDLADAPDTIMADEVRLRQIVFNLMANAIKFTDRGRVRLIAAARPVEGGGERLAIHIEDSGIGIPADAHETIFESFRQIDGGTTRRHGGTGLGLAICRNLARAMGGDVTVTSVLGAGSVFALDLPLERVAAPVATGVARDVAHLAEADLLLVEANPLSQGIMRAVLGAAVGGLHIVSDGEGALAALKGGGIDHVLADGATLGLDPDAVAKLVRATGESGARLTLLWPSPDESVRQALSAAGVIHLVSKPIGAPDLLVALQKVYADNMTGRDIAA